MHSKECCSNHNNNKNNNNNINDNDNDNPTKTQSQKHEAAHTENKDFTQQFTSCCRPNIVNNNVTTSSLCIDVGMQTESEILPINCNTERVGISFETEYCNGDNEDQISVSILPQNQNNQELKPQNIDTLQAQNVCPEELPPVKKIPVLLQTCNLNNISDGECVGKGEIKETIPLDVQQSDNVSKHENKEILKNDEAVQNIQSSDIAQVEPSVVVTGNSNGLMSQQNGFVELDYSQIPAEILHQILQRTTAIQHNKVPEVENEVEQLKPMYFIVDSVDKVSVGFLQNILIY